VRVVNEDGQQLGVMPVHSALDIAARIGLDLVEISAGASPPVCKIMDYGRYKFEIKKKAATAKRAQHQSQLKEVKFRPRIDEHDLDYKIRNARKFLFAGDKVKCTVMFRGREIVHAHIGRELLRTVEARLADIAAADGHPSMEGRTLSVTYTPNRRAIEKLRAEEERSERERIAREGERPEPVDDFDDDDDDTDEDTDEDTDADDEAYEPAEAAADAEEADAQAAKRGSDGA
jgi:translation initiation factor IF-3